MIEQLEICKPCQIIMADIGKKLFSRGKDDDPYAIVHAQFKKFCPACRKIFGMLGLTGLIESMVENIYKEIALSESDAKSEIPASA